MSFNVRGRHVELTALYPKPFLPHDSLPKYDAESCRRDAERIIAYFIHPFVKDYNFRCLEVGCGHGALSGLLALRGARSLGIDTHDFSADWKYWESQTPNAQFRKCDFHRSELQEETFDLIISVGTWEHLYHPVKALERSYRLLRPGGLFIAHIGMYFSRRGSHLYRLINYPHPTLFFNEEELEDLIGEGVPFVNTMTSSHYRDFCDRTGFRTLMWQEIEEAEETEIIRRYPKTFGKFPVEDLRVPLLNIVLWKPRSNELPCYSGSPKLLRANSSVDWRAHLPPLLPYQVEPIYAVAMQFVLPGASHVLDVGSGEGDGSRALATRANSVIGIESELAAIGIARKRSAANLQYRRGDAVPAMAQMDGSFDLVVLSPRARFASPAEMGKQIMRLLRKGGMVVMGHPHNTGISHLFERFGWRSVYDGQALAARGIAGQFGLLNIWERTR
jgi:SAM-dependent methyltransferase